jgi:NTE family protein
MKTALVLSGGGARAAYQVGVLKAITELQPEKGEKNPFDIICGTSSGAINAAKLACSAENFPAGINDLELIWSEIESHQVHRVGYRYLLKSVLKLIGSFFRRGVAFGRPLALLDNRPLNQLLEKHLQLKQLPSII